MFVNVLPPIAEWDGQFALPTLRPHQDGWRIFFDGEEERVVASRAEVDRFLAERFGSTA